MFVESSRDYVHIILMIITETFCVYYLSEDLLSTKLRQKCVCHPFPLLYGWFKVTVIFLLKIFTQLCLNKGRWQRDWGQETESCCGIILQLERGKLCVLYYANMENLGVIC